MNEQASKVRTEKRDPLGWLKMVMHDAQTMPMENLWKPEFDPTKDDPKASIVAGVPDDLKRLFTLYRDASAKASVAGAVAETARTPEQRDKLMAAATELHYTYRALKTLFWVSAQDYLGVWDGEKSLSITNNWEFGVGDSEPEPGLEGLLNRLKDVKAFRLG